MSVLSENIFSVFEDIFIFNRFQVFRYISFCKLVFLLNLNCWQKLGPFCHHHMILWKLKYKGFSLSGKWLTIIQKEIFIKNCLMLAEQTAPKHPNENFCNYSIVSFSNKNYLLCLELLEKYCYVGFQTVFMRPQAKATERRRGSLWLGSELFYPTLRRLASKNLSG